MRFIRMPTKCLHGRPLVAHCARCWELTDPQYHEGGHPIGARISDRERMPLVRFVEKREERKWR
jgi:hypothetical protein